MSSEHIKNIMRAWQEVVEKKTMDPVDKKALKKDFDARADKDIDNDGDADKSDEYLHKRRQAISKAMKNESEDEMKPCPKCDGSMQNHDPECPMADSGKEKEESSCGDKRMKKESFDEFLDSLTEEQLDEISAKLARKAAAASAAKSFEYGSSAYGPGTDKEADRLDKKADKARAHVQKRQGDKGVKKVDKKTGKLIYGKYESVAHEKWGYGEVIEESENGYNIYFEHGVEFDVPVDELTILEKNYAERTKGATKPETMKDQRKGKGAEDMAKDLDADSPELAADDAKGHEDATKAGRVVSKQAPTRGGEQRKGDINIVNPVKGAVTKTTGKE
jgi:hypothetical protein